MKNRRLVARLTLGFVSALAPLLVIGLAVLGARWLISGREPPRRVKQEERATFVDVVPVRPQTCRPTIRQQGTVRAYRQVRAGAGRRACRATE